MAVFVYLLTALLPGTAQELLAGLETSSLQNEADSDNIVQGFFSWIGNLLRFDFGVSYFSGEPVLRMVSTHWFPTLFLGVTSWAIAILISIHVVGAFFVSRKKQMNKIYLFFELLVLSFTPITIGLLVVFLISVLALPIPVFYSGTSVFLSLLRYVPPLAVLTVLQIPVYVRSLHVASLLTQKRPYIQFARGLGFNRKQLWWSEVLPNSLLYTVSLSSVQLSILLGGSILIESTFSIPGLGTLLVQAVRSRDLELVRFIVLFYGVIVAFLHRFLSLLHKKHFGLERAQG